MNRTFLEIAKDIVLAQNSYEVFDDEDYLTKLETLYGELRKKENGVYWLYREHENEIERVQSQIDKMKAYVRSLKHGQECIKELVIHTFESLGELPIQDDFNPIKISQSNGAVDVIDESKIPQEYFIEKVSSMLDRKRILTELKNGSKINGVRLLKKSFVRGLK